MLFKTDIYPGNPPNGFGQLILLYDGMAKFILNRDRLGR